MGDSAGIPECLNSEMLWYLREREGGVYGNMFVSQTPIIRSMEKQGGLATNEDFPKREGINQI